MGGWGLLWFASHEPGGDLKPHVVLSKKIPHIPNTIGMGLMKNLNCQIEDANCLPQFILSEHRGMGGEARLPHQFLERW